MTDTDFPDLDEKDAPIFHVVVHGMVTVYFLTPEQAESLCNEMYEEFTRR